MKRKPLIINPEDDTVGNGGIWGVLFAFAGVVIALSGAYIVWAIFAAVLHYWGVGI